MATATATATSYANLQTVKVKDVTIHTILIQYVKIHYL